jgi:transcription-repair coupling factor (superfamily II helicase)
MSLSQYRYRLLAHMPQADNNHNKKQNIPPHYLGKMPSSHYTVARDPESYMQMLLHLSVGEVINQREILSRLSQMQYTRNDVSLTRGHFRVKGGRPSHKLPTHWQ